MSLLWQYVHTRPLVRTIVCKDILSTDTPFLTSSEMEGVQEVNPALGHNKPVSFGCPLYNEASAVKGCLVLSSNVIDQRLD